MNQKFIDKFETLKTIDQLNDDDLKRHRGFEFEELINNVLEEEDCLLRRSYHTKDNKREQIDGAIEVWGRVLLVEVKWVSKAMAASELYSFIGKIENKFHGTLGVFISRNTLSDNFIRSLNTGRKQNVIVIHGEDVDLLFKDIKAPLFKDYIEYCIKLLSYDNITHFSVSKYLSVKKVPNVLNASHADGAKAFVKDFLNAKEKIPVQDLMIEFEALNPEGKNITVKFALDNYAKVWASIIQDFTRRSAENYRELFSQLSASEPSIQQSAEHYFSTVLFKDLANYSRDIFLNLYGPWYKSIDAAVKVEVEKNLVKELQKAYDGNDWNTENSLTELIRQLWTEFSEATTKSLKEIYLQIFVSNSRSEKFAQKQFAIYLLDKKIITKPEIEEWLKKRLGSVAKDYVLKNEKVPSGIVVILLNMYYSLGKYIDVDVLDFHTYVDSVLESFYSV